MDRMFGPYRKGSLRMATFTLINTAIGVGMLALPQAVANLGYAVGFTLLVVGAINLYLGFYCFKYLIFKYPDTEIYSELAGKICGPKMERFLNWVFIIQVYGSMTSYMTVTKKLAFNLVKDFIK